MKSIWYAVLLAVFCTVGRAAESYEVLAKDGEVLHAGAPRLQPPKTGDLAGWGNTNAVVRWQTGEVAKGTYNVVVVYSCDDQNAGSKLLVTVGNQHADFVVATTGTWMKYVEADLGPVILRKAGPVEITARITKIANRFGINLRAVKLVPVY